MSIGSAIETKGGRFIETAAQHGLAFVVRPPCDVLISALGESVEWLWDAAAGAANPNGAEGTEAHWLIDVPGPWKVRTPGGRWLMFVQVRARGGLWFCALVDYAFAGESLAELEDAIATI